MSTNQNVNECYICMLENIQLVDTCGFVSHKVCSICRIQLNKCPMCKVHIQEFNHLTFENALDQVNRINLVGPSLFEYQWELSVTIREKILRVIVNLLAIRYKQTRAKQIVRYLYENFNQLEVKELFCIIYCFWVQRQDMPELSSNEQNRMYMATYARILNAEELIDDQLLGLRKRPTAVTYQEIRSKVFNNYLGLIKFEL